MKLNPTGFTLWLTGLSGAGKSTLAFALHDVLASRQRPAEVLDGDLLRASLSPDLGFSRADRDANVRRIGFIANLLSRNGIVSVVAAIAPYRGTRDAVRREHQSPFVEVFVDCMLEELLRRDPKGLYARALRGELPHFTGISDPYEVPLSPDIHLRTDRESIAVSRDRVVRWLEKSGLLDDAAS